jgi:hypothetical protein
MSKKLILLGLAFALFLLSCQQNVYNLQDYYAYINAPENGLAKERVVGDMKFTLQYRPTEALVQQERSATISKNSLQEQYANSLTFLLKMEASEQAAQPFDVMTETVSSLQDFQQQTHALNFELQQLLYLELGERRVKPVLVVLENTYGLQQHRLVNIVFAKEELNEQGQLPKQLDVVFEDVLFGTGKHHFLIERAHIEQIPPLVL